MELGEDMQEDGCAYDSRSVPAFTCCSHAHGFLVGVNKGFYEPVDHGYLLGAATMFEGGYAKVRESGSSNGQLALWIQNGMPNAVVVFNAADWPIPHSSIHVIK